MRVPRNLIFDLDGVLYRGEEAVPGAGGALARVAVAGLEIVFVTNNSTRTVHETAKKIATLTGFEAQAEQVVSSAQAAAAMVTVEEGPVLLFGAAGARSALAERGLTMVDDWRDAGVVIVGLDPGLSYEGLTAAVMAVSKGARFIATNVDVTYPTPEGLWPGAGALVAAVQAATGVEPEVAGKPHAAMRKLLRDRLAVGESLVVGDRPETDLALGVAEGWTTVLVLSGVTPPEAEVVPPPDHVLDTVADLPSLLGI